MALYPVRGLDGVGIIRDLPEDTLPPQGWSNGRNIRFTDGSAEQIDGESAFGGAAPIKPYFAMTAPEVTTHEDIIIVAGLSAVYILRDSTWTDITRSSGPYNGAGSNAWNGTIIGGVAVINNAVDAPQQWVFPPNSATKLQNLTGWSASWTCKVMRHHLNYLVALDVTKSGTRFPYMVKWSHAAEPGMVPTSWDIADPTLDAGEVNIAEGGGFIIDAVPMRDQLLIYKEHSTHAMRWVGGNQVFAFYQLFPGYGLLSPNAVGQLYNRHFVVTQSDIIVHDGAMEKSVASRRVKRWFFNQLSSDTSRKVFVVPNYRRQEMWVCFIQAGGTVPDTALLWSWETNTWGDRDLPDCPSIATGGIAFGVDSATWEADGADDWDADDLTWYEGQENREQQLVLVDTTNDRLLVAGIGKDFAGSFKRTYVQRQKIPIGEGTHMHDMKNVRAIWPQVTTSGNKSITITVGVHKTANSAVTWGPSQTFNPETDRKVNVNQTGVALALEIESQNGASFRLSGYDIEYDKAGTF